MTPFVVACVVLFSVTEAAYTDYGTVYADKNGSLYYVAGKIDKTDGVAYGSLEYSVQENGWAVLNVEAGKNPAVTDDKVTMKAAGYLEGALTNKMIYDHYVNIYNWTFNGRSQQFVSTVNKWFANQRAWLNSNINKFHTTNQILWKYMELLNEQYQGLYEGYNGQVTSDKKLDWFSFDILNGNGDMLDLLYALDPDNRPDFGAMSKEELKSWVASHSHCSVLIKMLPGYENLYAGHSSWFTYASMLRIYKHYAFYLQDNNAATNVMSFSSYPAYLSSLDDFYIMDSLAIEEKFVKLPNQNHHQMYLSFGILVPCVLLWYQSSSGLVMLQTTNGVFNHSIYSLVSHDALLAWQRVRIANWLATNGKDWSYYVSQYNSGTYNNQYMVLDLKLIQLQNSLPDNTLWVVEQLPGLMVSADQTAILREGYWASYNVPFYEEVFQLSGYADAAKKYGEEYTHDLAVRAKIFRRDQGKVVDLSTYQTLMQSNDYMTDPYANHNPMGAICSRGDLGSPPQSGGCTDSKVTDYNMAKNLTAYIRSGPTHQDLTPFQWSKSPFSIPHLGQPDLFNFDFIQTSPSIL